MHAAHIAVLIRAMLQVKRAGFCRIILCGRNNGSIKANIFRFYREAERPGSSILCNVAVELNAGNGDHLSLIHI